MNHAAFGVAPIGQWIAVCRFPDDAGCPPRRSEDLAEGPKVFRVLRHDLSVEKAAPFDAGTRDDNKFHRHALPQVR